MPFRYAYVLPVLQGLLYPVTFATTIVSKIAQKHTEMPFKYCWVLPVLEGVIYPVTFVTTYILSTTNGDVPTLFPYVSDTGAWSLARCIFTLMLGFGALLMMSTLYLRYRQVKDTIDDHKEDTRKQKLIKFNIVSLWLAVISVLGVFTLGCFQVEPFLIPHILAAVTAFGFGLMVISIQTYISFKIYPTLGNQRLNIFRLLLNVIILVAFSVSGLFGLLSLLDFRGDDITKWTPESGGYEYHVISAVGEWVLIMGFVLYLSLYAAEFKSIVMYKPNIKLVDKA